MLKRYMEHVAKNFQKQSMEGFSKEIPRGFSKEFYGVTSKGIQGRFYKKIQINFLGNHSKFFEKSPKGTNNIVHQSMIEFRKDLKKKSGRHS